VYAHLEIVLEPQNQRGKKNREEQTEKAAKSTGIPPDRRLPVLVYLATNSQSDPKRFGTGIVSYFFGLFWQNTGE
jgi:hypothetical protein